MAKIYYFADLVDKLGRASEDVELPEAVKDVRSLLQWLRGRGDQWETVLTEDSVRVTINKQFSVPETALDNSHEIAIFPVRR